jgi:hypothetical protein
MRKRKISVQDLGRLPVTEVKTTGTEGFEDYKQAAARVKRENAEAVAKQKAEADKVIRNNELAKSASVAAALQIKREALLTEPSEVLAAHCPKSPMTATTADEYSAQMLAAIRKGLSGVTFDDAGKNKLMHVAGLNRMHVNLTDSRVWETLFDHMVELGVFAPSGALAKPEPVIEPITPSPAQPKPSIDGLSTEHREQNREIQRIVGLNWSSDVQEFYMQWADSMMKSWQFDVMTESMARRVGEYQTRWNLSPLRAATYNQIRRAFSNLGYFIGPDGPRDLRLPEEILADQMENFDLSNRDVKRDIGLRTKGLMEMSQR